MNKNILIAALAIVVLGLSGWLIYDKAGRNATIIGPLSGSNDSNVLNYSNQNLSSVDPNIYNQTSATQLILSNNRLTSLPSQLGGMDKLHVLKVDHNLLQGALIAEIRKMPLVTLDASHNNMTGIPAEIGQLNQLQNLDYSYNKIDTLPDEIAHLKQLKTINVTGNPLSASQISRLRAELPNTTVLF